MKTLNFKHILPWLESDNAIISTVCADDSVYGRERHDGIAFYFDGVERVGHIETFIFRKERSMSIYWQLLDLWKKLNRRREIHLLCLSLKIGDIATLAVAI